MLVTFTTDAHADIILFGDVALAMLNDGTQRDRAHAAAGVQFDQPRHLPLHALLEEAPPLLPHRSIGLSRISSTSSWGSTWAV